ncbi:ligated ion channel l-glutamate- and glycine-binding site domain-containing protein [Ditylenchus destructor]|uniref:Ligated ion channel l-glutamate- and glycine-binding site domain-containing protein n=1 Tax=Ditylenchus destructor TaxID=166010 RepID=A0AAD4NA76_9BILA|nr:ligated ion channel l-glutamate- and glycine-binding site domain-containing protein [Ditylenchus destructor]
MPLWIFLLFLSIKDHVIVMGSIQADTSQKQVVNIGLVYQNYAQSKVYQKAFKEAIRNINNGQSITPVDCILPKGQFYPSDVLNCLCETMISNKVALIIFVTASEEFDEVTAASQYFLHMASQTGIPIIAWNADNSGYTFSKPLSEYRIIQMAPPIVQQIQAMIALLRRYNWSRFGVVATKMAGSKQFIKLVQDEIQLQDDRYSFPLEIVHHTEIDINLGHSHIEQHLKALKNSEARIILLYSNIVKVRSLFQVAGELGLLSEKYLWIGTQSVKGALTFALPPTQPGMLTVNFHTVSNAMFPPADDLFGLALAKLDMNESVSLASTSTCSFNSSNMVWPLGEHIYSSRNCFVIKPPFLIVSELDPETNECPGKQGAICDWGDYNLTMPKCCTGYCVDLLNKLAEDVGFTYTLYKVRDEKWGLKSENGTWNGLIHDLTTHKADMCVTSLKLNSERARDIDFSIPFLETGISIVVKIRSGLFSASVSTDVPRSCVSRIMSLVWAAFGLTFLAVYTANLAAFMITRVQYYDLSGLDDERMIYPDQQEPPFRYGTVEGGNTHETMRRNWQQMHKFVERNKYFSDNVSAGIEAVRNEKLDAFVYDAVVLDYQAGKDVNCELMTVGKWAVSTGYGIGFPKNSPHVNRFMLQYQQKGDLERLQNFWLTGACVKDSSHSQQSHSAPLGIENFMSAFFLLGAGIFVGVLCLVGEYLYCSHLRKTLQKFDSAGWCGVISMAMGKSLSFTEAVDRIQDWHTRVQSSSAVVVSPLPLRKVAWVPPANRKTQGERTGESSCLNRETEYRPLVQTLTKLWAVFEHKYLSLKQQMYSKACDFKTLSEALWYKSGIETVKMAKVKQAQVAIPPSFLRDGGESRFTNLYIYGIYAEKKVVSSKDDVAMTFP